MSIRRNIKTAVQTLLNSATGIKAVYTYKPKLMNQFPAVVINLKQSDEERVSSPIGQGKKRQEFVCSLEITMIDSSPDGSGQLTFDDALDAIDVKLRSDYTLGGTVLASAVEYIKTQVAPPIKVDGENVLLAAVKTFDICFEFNA